MKTLNTLALVAVLFPSTALAQLVPIPGNPTLEPATEATIVSCHECVDLRVRRRSVAH